MSQPSVLLSSCHHATRNAALLSALPVCTLLISMTGSVGGYGY
jgi:hypothetical protein